MRNVSKGNWNYDPVLNTWKYVINMDNVQVNVGKDLTGGLQKLAAGGLYTLPTGKVAGETAIYYFDNGGNMQTGLQTIGDSIYLFAATGEMLFGDQVVNGQTFHFDETTGKLALPGQEKIGALANTQTAQEQLMQLVYARAQAEAAALAAQAQAQVQAVAEAQAIAQAQAQTQTKVLVQNND